MNLHRNDRNQSERREKEQKPNEQPNQTTSLGLLDWRIKTNLYEMYVNKNKNNKPNHVCVWTLPHTGYRCRPKDTFLLRFQWKFASLFSAKIYCPNGNDEMKRFVDWFLRALVSDSPISSPSVRSMRRLFCPTLSL